jgi:FlaA1/EpsC-like NDP-sugar epimerase
MRLRLFFRNRFLLLGDLFLIIVCVLGSFVLRLNLGPLFLDHLQRAIIMAVIALIIKPIIYNAFGMYRRLWIYASIQEVKLIIVTVTTASVFVSLTITILTAFRAFEGFSRSVLFIDWLLSLLAVGGLRFTQRVVVENKKTTQESFKHTRRVLIVGAGDAGELVVREMQKNTNASSTPNVRLLPVGFADDDPAKQKQQIHDVPVVGTLREIPKIIESQHIDEVIIAIPSAPGQVVRTVMDMCRVKGVPFRTIPSLNELIGGKVSVNRLRDVEITDLLRRQPARIDNELVGMNISRRRVLVTGAGGSIGKELCRQIARWGPSSMVLLGHGENSIFEALVELEEDFPSVPLHAVIADIRNLDRLRYIFRDYRPHVVFHAAAHKHVPLMESNVEEAVLNNILGTKNTVEAALEYSTEHLVLISTDKAVKPSSVMGATKRIAEAIVLDAALRSGMAYCVVRFGNVLGSRGSIVPIFKRQISRGGPITLTHPDMKRYFMTIPEAVHLVLQAFAMGKGGETFVLNMGEQVRILDLAEDLIRLSGLEPGKDIEIIFTGIRPGEKISEALWDEDANYQPTAHPDVVSLSESDNLTGEKLENAIDQLYGLVKSGDTEAVLRKLDDLVPGSAVRDTPPPEITAIV